jgi:energy-coupling factor transport system permease protein
MPPGQYVHGDSILYRFNAWAKIICLFILLAAIITTKSLWGYVLIICATAGIVFASRLPLDMALGSLRRLWLFFIIIFLMNALFFGGEDTLWSWWIFGLSLAGAKQGANVAMRVALLIVLSNVLTCTTAPMDMTNALKSLMKPLKFIGFPVEDVAMIISVAIQFIPTLIEETDMIQKAQIARGARFESKKLTEKAASVFPLIIPTFLSAFRRADELSVAMEARGYRDAKRRTKKEKEPLKAADIIAIITCAVICMLQVSIF